MFNLPIAVTNADLYGIMSIIIIMISIFLFSLFGEEKIEDLKWHRYLNSLVDKDFYKIPLRYVGISYFALVGLFRKKERNFALHAIKIEHKDTLLDDEIVKSIASSPSHFYSLFVLSTINYFQKKRSLIKSRKNRDGSYLGFQGLIGLHRDANKVNEDKITQVFQKRYDLGFWLPPETRNLYHQKEANRYDAYLEYVEKKKQDEEEEKNLYDVTEGYKDIKIQPRTVKKQASKRFDSKLK